MNMRTKIFLLLITITLVGCNNKMKISPGTYEAVAMGGTHPLGGKITSVSNEGNLITVNLCISNVSMTGNGRVFI